MDTVDMYATSYNVPHISTLFHLVLRPLLKTMSMVPPAMPFLQDALRQALGADYPHAAGKRRELLSRVASMELIFRKLEECRGKVFQIQAGYFFLLIFSLVLQFSGNARHSLSLSSVLLVRRSMKDCLMHIISSC